MKTRRLPMTPLRQRMLEDMQLRNYSPLTMHCYLRCVADFARHFGASPAHLGPEQVRSYQLFLLQDNQVSWTSVVQTVCALRFFDRITLGRPEILEYIASPQRPFTLPLILSPAEVATLLTTPRNLKHRAILTTFYAAGLRVSELAPLPEAPVSITLKATLHGHEVLVTLRGVDFASVRSQVEDASQWLQAHGGHATQATPQCPTHGAMKPSTKGKGWYCPHTLADGSWCKGK